MTGKFLFYAQVIDNTILHALNTIATATINGTETTMVAMKYFQNYAASNPNEQIKYCASNMIQQTHSNAAYLVAPEAQSRVGGYHFSFLVNKDQNLLFNGPVFVLALAKIIHNIMSSAAEAEVIGLYMNAKEDTPIQNSLTNMGHPQPAIPITTVHRQQYALQLVI